MTEHTSPDHLREEFWDRIEDVRAGMLSTPSISARPMSHSLREKDGMIWFITAHGTDVADAAKGSSQATYIVASSSAKIYATINGTMSVETDRDILNDVWSPIAAAWFEDGKDDPDICLVGFKPVRADIWATDGGARFLYEVAKGNLTGKKPDMGDHGTVTF